MTYAAQDWKLSGACNGQDPRWWEPAGRGEPPNKHLESARAICFGCPVIQQCHADALADVKNRIQVMRAGIVYDAGGAPTSGRKGRPRKKKEEQCPSDTRL